MRTTTVSVDWDLFLTMTHRHRLVPHVVSAINAGAFAGIPASVVLELKGLQQSIVMKNCFLAAELRRIVAAFEEAGTAIRPFKGPTLAIENYGGLEGRQFNDLDLLIRPVDFSAALCLLRDLNFHPELSGIEQLTKRRIQQLTARTNELTLVGASTNHFVKIDLHWRYSSAPCFFETPHEKLFQGVSRCQLGDRTIPTIPLEQQIVYLAYHACKHQCLRLSWLCDFGVAMSRIPRQKWRGFLDLLNPNDRRFVICSLLTLERLSLLESLESDLANIRQWRQRLRGVIENMVNVMTADDAVPLLGTLPTAFWRWRLSGRMRPLLRTLFQAALPTEQDLSKPGPAGPWLSRLKTVIQKVSTETSDSPSDATRERAVA